jgi:acetyltransferase-like isoleucine patch superfamily enzyme
MRLFFFSPRALVQVNGRQVRVPRDMVEEIRRLQGFEQRVIQAEVERHELLYGNGQGVKDWADKQPAIARIVLRDEARRWNLMARFFSSYGGGRHHTAIIGHPPQHRDWRPGDPVYKPEIHPSARIEAYVCVDGGMKEPTRIGEDSWLLKQTHVGHDVQIGKNVEVATGTVIAGHAVIEDGVHIGINASILPGVRIGRGSRVGAGSVVTKDVPDRVIVAGNPARFLRER